LIIDCENLVVEESGKWLATSHAIILDKKNKNTDIKNNDEKNSSTEEEEAAMKK